MMFPIMRPASIGSCASAKPWLHRLCDEPARCALDFEVLPVKRIHHFIGVIEIEADKENPTEAHRPTIDDVVHRPAGPIRLHIMAQQRERRCIWKGGLTHATRASSGSDFFIAEASL